MLNIVVIITINTFSVCTFLELLFKVVFTDVTFRSFVIAEVYLLAGHSQKYNKFKFYLLILRHM